MLPPEPDPDLEPRKPVTRQSTIGEVLANHPDAARILWEEFNLPCYDCEVRFVETIETGVSYTGLDPDVVVARLNGVSRVTRRAPEDAPPDGAA